MSLTSSRVVPSPSAFTIDPAGSLGLSLRVHGGYLLGGAAWQNIATVSLLLADNATNYVEVNGIGVTQANTVGFSSGAIFLYRVVTAAGVVAAIEDWRANPGVADPGVPVFSRTVTLTNSEIKTLHSVGKEIVPAPGAGKIAVPIGMVFVRSFVADYVTDGDQSPQLYHPGGPGTGLSAILNVPLVAGGLPVYAAGVEANVNVGGTFDGYVLEVSGLVANAPIRLEDHWTGADYTGGDPANTLTVTVIYIVAAASAA